MGGTDIGWYCDMRTGGPPGDEFHHFLVEMQKRDLPPTRFHQGARHPCLKVAVNPQLESSFDYSMNVQDVVEDYKNKTISTQMRGVAAHAIGRECRFDDPTYTKRPLE